VIFRLAPPTSFCAPEILQSTSTGTCVVRKSLKKAQRGFDDSSSRSAKTDQQFARWVMLHVQSNPLPICTRPRALIKGKRT
jgi:Phage major capsid protein E